MTTPANEMSSREASEKYAFDRALSSVLLSTDLQTGNFTTVVPWQGKQAVYRFSLAVGLGSLFWRSKYSERFRQPAPPWLDLLHPLIAWRACKVALEYGIPLPQQRPAEAETSIQAFVPESA